MKKTLLIIAASAALGAVQAQAETLRVVVSIENLAPQRATFQTPFWVAFHDGTFDTYDGGTPANSDPIDPDPRNSIERLAEDGATGPLMEAFAELAPDGIDATLPGPNGPIAPGDTAVGSFVLDPNNPAQRYFSYASMVIPSNDFFISNGNPLAHEIFDEAGNLVATDFFITNEDILDAGTEVNDEIPENTAFFGQTAADTGVDENGVILDFGDPLVAFMPVGSGGILDDPMFAMADFTLPGYPVAKISFASAPAIVDELSFSATLSGDQEVPPVDTPAIGSAQYQLLDEGTRLVFSHQIIRLRGIVAAHLHLGAAGENGPIVAFLFDPNNFDPRTTARGFDGELTSQDLTGPLAGQPLDALIAEILAGNIYINVHTQTVPSGEVRGQL